MEAPTILEKVFLFKNNQGSTIEVKINIKDNNIIFKTELSENQLNKRRFSSKYSIDAIKENNKYFFLCQNLNDIYKQIDLLAKENKSSYVLEHSKIDLIIPTNMELAPEIKIELLEEQKDLLTKVNDINEYILNKEKVNENNISLLIKENKEIKELLNVLIKENREMKETINSIKSSYDLLNKDKLKILNTIKTGIIDEEYFNKIKDWIGGDRNKIKFELIFNFNENFSDKVRDTYNNKCNISAPAIFIFFTENSLFGAYCPYYQTNGGSWINDSNAFLFSLNLNVKFPAQKSQDNYYRGSCGFHFKDITFCSMNDRKGTFSKSGTYLNKYVLEGYNNGFYVKQFLVYKVNK